MDLSNQHEKTMAFRPWSDEKPGPSKDYLSASYASSPMMTLASTPTTSRSSSSSPNPKATNYYHEDCLSASLASSPKMILAPTPSTSRSSSSSPNPRATNYFPEDYVSSSNSSSPKMILASTLSTSTSRSSSSSSSPNPGATNYFPAESLPQPEPAVSNFSSSNFGFAVPPHFLQYCMPFNGYTPSYTPSFPWTSTPTMMFPTAYNPLPKVLPKLVGLCPGEQAQQTVHRLGEQEVNVDPNLITLRPEEQTQPSVQHLGDQEVKVKKNSKSRPKSIACPHPGCLSTFSNKGQQTAHYRIHTGERPFECEECNKKFTRKEELTRHRRIHTGVKPFICLECGKRFRRSDHLKTHDKIHQRERLRIAGTVMQTYAPVYQMPVAGYPYHPSSAFYTNTPYHPF